MKKFWAILLMVMTLCVGTACAEDVLAVEEKVFELSGLIMEITPENDLLISTVPHGDVLVHVSDKTVISGVETLEIGQYVYIRFNGVMTMSLPGQITADEIDCHRFEGEVVAVAGNNVQLKTEDGAYCLVLSKEIDVAFSQGETIYAYAQRTGSEFAGLEVLTAEFVGTVAPDKARTR